jgi:hypothetical protein
VKNRSISVRSGALALGLVIVVAGAGGAAAARLITGDDIARQTITGRNIADDTLGKSKLKQNVLDGITGPEGPAGPQGPEGPQGPAGPAGAATEYAGENWTVVHRNVIGNGDADLQAGPANAPYGIGALMLRTGSAEDKASFGNEVDFAGDELAAIDTLSYWAYTTGENNARYNENNISLNLEIDPTGAGTVGPNYSSLVYVPVQAAANKWTEQDASSAARWCLTGAAATASGCTQASYCTLDEVQAAYADATILTVQLTKGRDYAFSGAADGLRINDDVYDFEPFGVSKVTVDAQN